MIKWPARGSSSPHFSIPEAPIDVHSLKIQADLSHQGGSCLLGLDRKAPGDSTSEKPFKTFLTPVQQRQIGARNLSVTWDFKECLHVSSFEKGAQSPSWGKQNSGFSPGLIGLEMSLQLHWDGVSFSVLVLQFQGFQRFLPLLRRLRAPSFWFSSRLVIFITGVSLPQWIWFWRAFRNSTLWMFSLLLIFSALGPQSPHSRNLWALLSIFVINPGLRETWGLEDCWTPYVSGAMLEFPCYKQQRKRQNSLRIWLRPLNLLISTDQSSLQSSNSATAWINTVSFIQRLQEDFTDSNEWIQIEIIPHGQKRNCLYSTTGKMEKYIGWRHLKV